jgi:GNAT superfamily N-acetyltransferase
MTIKIRRISKDDMDELAEIYDQTYSPSVFDVGERWTKESAHKMLNYWLKRNSDLAFLAEDNGKIVGGFFLDVKPWWDGNHLVDGEIFVHPDYQKKGIGTKLLKFMFEYALKRYNAVRWDTYTIKGKYPLEWYKSLGFGEIEEWAMISGNVKDVLDKLK